MRCQGLIARSSGCIFIRLRVKCALLSRPTHKEGSRLKHHIADLLSQAIARLAQEGLLPPDLHPVIELERTRQKEHGDFACNIALTLTRAAKIKPRDLATAIVAAVPASNRVAKIEIAGPGFINFFLTTGAY